MPPLRGPADRPATLRGSGSYRVRHPSADARSQPFRLLLTGSRTWDDIPVIEHALAVILDRHPEGVLLVHGACPRGADAIAAAYAARTPGYRIEAHPAG